MLNSVLQKNSMKHKLSSMTRTRQLGCFLTSSKINIAKQQNMSSQLVKYLLIHLWITSKKTNTLQGVIKNSHNEEKDE